MNQDVSLKMTELDRLTSLPHMQLVKAALPYIHIPEQRFFSLFVKFRELEKTMQLFADPPTVRSESARWANATRIRRLIC